MRVHRHPLASAVGAATVATCVALRCLSPRRSLRPAAAKPTGYFTPTEIERARAFRGPQELIAAVNLAAAWVALGFAAVYRPPTLSRALERTGKRPLAGAFCVGAGLWVGVALVSLPLDVVAQRRSVRAGLSSQKLSAWFFDASKTTALASAGAGAVAAGTLAIIRRFPARWWLVCAAAGTFASACFLTLAPIVIQPLFNRFRPLEPGSVRDEVLALSQQAGVDVGAVLCVDASRRTSALNAYVTGLFKTKRVVVYDTLLERLPAREIRLVVAHELAHVKHRDLWRGLAFTALVMPGAMLVVKRGSEQMTASDSAGIRRGQPAPTPELVPSLALWAFAVSFFLGLAANALSRAVEVRADAFSLDLTRDPSSAIALERDLATQNLARPARLKLAHLLWDTHPTPLERIGLALAWQDTQAVPQAAEVG